MSRSSLTGVFIGTSPRPCWRSSTRGAHHFAEDQIVRDDARIQRLQAAGRRVLRRSAVDLRDLDAVVEQVPPALLR